MDPIGWLLRKGKHKRHLALLKRRDPDQAWHAVQKQLNFLPSKHRSNSQPTPSEHDYPIGPTTDLSPPPKRFHQKRLTNKTFLT